MQSYLMWYLGQSHVRWVLGYLGSLHAPQIPMVDRFGLGTVLTQAPPELLRH
jgi:hypothetical protein